MRFRGASRIAAAWVLLACAPASAATIETETDGDDFGNPVTAGICTLREAVEAARTNQPFGGCPRGDASKRDVIQVAGAAFLDVTAAGPDTNAAGDLDYDKGGKLTIRGGESFDPVTISGFGAWSTRLLEVRKEKVKLVGVELTNGDTVGDADSSGGAIRATNGARLTIQDSDLNENSAGNRGGAIACEGCASVRLLDNFTLDDNAVVGVTAAGGAIWSNAPVRISGTPSNVVFPGTQSRIADNTTTSAPPAQAEPSGGGIYAGDDLTISKTTITDNDADNGSGGGIAFAANSGKLEMTDSRVALNTADGSAGGILVDGPEATMTLRRTELDENAVDPDPESDTARGGGIASAAEKNLIVESVIDQNSATAQMPAGVRGGGMMLSRPGGEPELTRIVRSSVTNNVIGSGQFQQGGGIYVSGRLEMVNSTVSNNVSFGAGGRGGGIQVALESFDDEPSAKLDFTTVADNSAGSEGDQLWVQTKVSLRASLLSPLAGDTCFLSGDGVVNSRGYNVYAGPDDDCAIDHPDDDTGNPLLSPLSANGSPPVGYIGSAVALTHAVTSDPSSALNLIPPGKCKVDGKRLKSDARGVPRPVQGGCEVGAIERVKCLGFTASGPKARIGRNASENIQGEFGQQDVVLARGGDDVVQTYSGVDRICGGSGDDVVQPQADDDKVSGGPGTDVLNYNNAMPGGLELDLGALTATGPTIGSDEFSSIENAQGSEDDDDIRGNDGRNRLIGGGGDDELRGRGGIDVIDAREGGGGDPDVLIDCGPGDNSKEKAIVDPEDPAPVNC